MACFDSPEGSEGHSEKKKKRWRGYVKGTPRVPPPSSDLRFSAPKFPACVFASPLGSFDAFPAFLPCELVRWTFM